MYDSNIEAIRLNDAIEANLRALRDAERSLAQTSQMNAARGIMKKRRVALRELAK